MNSKLVHYLNEGVKVKDKKRTFDLYLGNVAYCCSDLCTPYLYPLSCLTESIPYDGRMVVPLVELYKLSLGVDCIKYIEANNELFNFFFIDDCIELSFRDFRFGFDSKDMSFILAINGDCIAISNQLSLFQLLLKMRINIFPDEIESIDPRTELVNPYL